MKRIFLMMFMAGCLIIVAFTGCKKETFRPVSTSGVATSQTAGPVTFNLVADQWVFVAGEVYVNTFHNVLTYAQVSAHTPVHVYLETNTGEQPLGTAPIMFEDHELWIGRIGTDITLNYRCYDQHIPFNFLNIKIVIG